MKEVDFIKSRRDEASGWAAWYNWDDYGEVVGFGRTYDEAVQSLIMQSSDANGDGSHQEMLVELALEALHDIYGIKRVSYTA